MKGCPMMVRYEEIIEDSVLILLSQGQKVT